MTTEEPNEHARSDSDRPAPFAGYGAGEEMPLSGYAGLMTVYTVGAAGVFALVEDRLPKRMKTSDILLLGVATHKLTQIITQDWVTSPLRAPFTTYEGSSGGGEVSESSRGSGLRRAVGDLLTCPWCLGPWVATTLTAALVRAPRPTRWFAGSLAIVAVSDTLHHGYRAVKSAAEGSRG